MTKLEQALLDIVLPIHERVPGEDVSIALEKILGAMKRHSGVIAVLLHKHEMKEPA